MKNQISRLFVLACIAFNSSAMIQNVLPSKEGMYPDFIKYDKNQPAFTPGKIEVTDVTGKKFVAKEVKLQKVSTDKQGISHYRYQQELNNIPVENAIWIVHTKSGKTKSQNGNLVKSFTANLASKAVLNSSQALAKALLHINAKRYKWELPAEEEFLRKEKKNASATYYPKATLVYYSGEEKVNPATLRLAYKFDIYAQEPLSRKYVFVDALNGKILGERERIHSGAAETVYSGTQNISTNLFNGNGNPIFILREEGPRGPYGGYVSTRNMANGYDYANFQNFEDDDDYWNNVNPQKDEFATDAHWGGEMTYDYYANRHGRNSLDDAGFQLVNFVHFGVDISGAFWDGMGVSYGDGNWTYANQPLTTLDICGHEFTHGVTEFTSGLVYSDESGAMNEGFSDIFGTAIEAYARPTQWDWVIGGDYYPLRDMSNPNAYQQPDTYQGDYWGNEVHINSGVLNHWFYLLSVGGSGINDNGIPYNVQGIGMQNAEMIAYRLNTFYLIPTSIYSDARTLGIQAAEDLFGVSSPEAIATSDAWTAVGLYGTSPRTSNAMPTLETLYLVSPNPSDGIFRIKYSSPYATLYYEVMNVSGDVVKKSYVNASDEIVIDIFNQASGIYFLRVSDALDNRWVLKLFKK